MKSFARIAVLTCLCLFGFVVSAQTPPVAAPQTVTPKAPYDSTKAQLSVTKEENLQLKANAAQAAFQQQMKNFQAAWQAEEASLRAWIAHVKKSNGWDDTYVYDRTKNEWTHTPKADAKPTEAPKK